MRRNPRQYAWFAGTGATAAAVFLITFFAVSAATDDDGSPPTSSIATVTLPGSEEADVPAAVADAPEEQAEPEPVVSQQPAQEPVQEDEPTAAEQPEVVVDPSVARVPLPDFDKSDLIHGGTGSRGAILAGHGIVPSSGATAQTDWVLLIPSARIKASIVRVGLAPGNAFGSPDNPEVIGWWESGPAPGQVGNPASQAGGRCPRSAEAPETLCLLGNRIFVPHLW